MIWLMPERFNWIGTTGGPHVLVAVENLAEWRGIDRWTGNGPDDPSDYARACRVRNWLGKVSSDAGCEVVVLSGDVGPIAWLPTPGGEAGTLVQLLFCDSEDDIVALLEHWQDTPPGERAYEEGSEFDTGLSGVMKLFDSSEAGDGLDVTGITLALKPGRQKIRATYVKNEKCGVVLRDVMTIPRNRDG